MMNKTTYAIGDLSSLTKCSVPTIRYYEKVGLLPTPKRTGSGHRYYSEDDIKRLTFIRRCRSYGFSINEIGVLLRLADNNGPLCTTGHKLVEKRLTEIRQAVFELRQVESTLENCLLREEQYCKTAQGAKLLDYGKFAP